MAPHKGVEVLIEALGMLRRRHGCDATLVLVGAWPDSAYEQRMRHLVAELSLEPFVDFRGHVPQVELYAAYAESRVFALMSRCESFGIPAVEAQAFGTPVISSNTCAIPEVCGAGGMYPGPRDVEGTAEALAVLIEDDARWEAAAKRARENAARFHWDQCSAPFVHVFGDK